MKALRRSCARQTRRRAEWIQIATEATKAQRTMPPITASHSKVGSASPIKFDGMKFCGMAQAGAHEPASAANPAMARAGIVFLAPVCQILPAIDHPRISALQYLVWRLWIG